MPKRDWRTWPRRMRDEANSASGLFALGTAVVAGAGFAVALPIAVGMGGALSLATLAACAYRSRPPVRPHPSELMNRTIRDLSELETAAPQLTRIGFIGASRVGKSTLLRNLQARIPDGLVTDDPYAVVVLLQTVPVSYFGLVDAAGQAYAQQFRVFSVSTKVIVMVDHDVSETATHLSEPRLKTHEDFLEQLRESIRVSPHKVTNIHFLLNKADLWEGSAERQELEAWFERVVADWKRQAPIKITSGYYSNKRVNDLNSLVTSLSQWSAQ